MRLAPPAMAISLIALSGCSLLHSNIKGGFACAAPRGTCAPSMRIDDAAIHEIGGQDDNGRDKSATPAGSNADLAQAVPDEKTGRHADRRAWIFVRGSRSALKVVYPEWRDATGQLHARTAAYAPVDLAPAPSHNVSAIDRGNLGRADSGSLLAIAEMAPEIGALPASPQAADQATKSDEKPAPPPERQAQTGATRPGALDAIKDQVKQILSNAGHPEVGASLPKPATAPTTPAASFPPAGN